MDTVEMIDDHDSGTTHPMTKPDFSEYPAWFAHEVAWHRPGEDTDVFFAYRRDQEEQFYNKSVEQLIAAFLTSEFWVQFERELIDYDAKLFADEGYPLLAHPGKAPKVIAKRWPSVV